MHFHSLTRLCAPLHEASWIGLDLPRNLSNLRRLEVRERLDDLGHDLYPHLHNHDVWTSVQELAAPLVHIDCDDMHWCTCWTRVAPNATRLDVLSALSSCTPRFKAAPPPMPTPNRAIESAIIRLGQLKELRLPIGTTFLTVLQSTFQLEWIHDGTEWHHCRATKI
jgi:hypothetical protein